MTVVLGIDWGSKMLGLAKVSLNDTVIFPVGYVKNDGDLYFTLAWIVAQEHVSQIVIWLPQKELIIQENIKSFVKKLQLFIDLPIDFVEEDYTSVEAWNLLSKIQPWKSAYIKTPAKDSVAAMKILERWINLK